MVELGSNTEPGSCGIGGEAGVVAAALGMAGQCFGVAPNAKCRRSAGEYNHPHCRILFEFGENPAILGMHAPCPCVVALGTVQPHGGNVLV